MFRNLLPLCTGLLTIYFARAAPTSSADGANKALFLTPYIEGKNVEEGRRLSQVTGLGWNVTSYSGLLTVDKKCGSNLFFWFFPSEREPAKVPLVIWLNGFSTASSYGIFLQNGPYSLLESAQFTPRSTSWQKYFNVLYIDNPVGVGFSFTGSQDCYSTDFDGLSSNLHNALTQFVQLFPDLRNRELYLSGLSLGGKYVSSFAYRIFKQKSFMLKGIFLGNPLLNLNTQLNYADYLYQLGFIDMNQAKGVDEREAKIIKALAARRYKAAYEYSMSFLLDDESYLLNITGLNNVYNYDFPYINTIYYDAVIGSKKLKRAVHVGDTPFGDGVEPMKRAAKIFDISVTGYLQEMIETVRMLFYAGQVDISAGYPMLVDTLQTLNWSGKAGYASAERRKLYADDLTGPWGYLRNYRTLTDVMVRKASHSTVTDKPLHILNLLLNFTQYDRFL